MTSSEPPNRGVATSAADKVKDGKCNTCTGLTYYTKIQADSGHPPLCIGFSGEGQKRRLSKEKLEGLEEQMRNVPPPDFKVVVSIGYTQWYNPQLRAGYLPFTKIGISKEFPSDASTAAAAKWKQQSSKSDEEKEKENMQQKHTQANGDMKKGLTQQQQKQKKKRMLRKVKEQEHELQKTEHDQNNDPQQSDNNGINKNNNNNSTTKSNLRAVTRSNTGTSTNTSAAVHKDKDGQPSEMKNTSFFQENAKELSDHVKNMTGAKLSTQLSKVWVHCASSMKKLTQATTEKISKVSVEDMSNVMTKFQETVPKMAASGMKVGEMVLKFVRNGVEEVKKRSGRDN